MENVVILMRLQAPWIALSHKDETVYEVLS